METEGIAPVPEGDGRRLNTRAGDGTLIGSGTRDWLLQQFAEIDLQFGAASPGEQEPTSCESDT